MSLSEISKSTDKLVSGEGGGGGAGMSESGCGSRCFDCLNGNCINSCNFRTEADINMTQKVSYGSLIELSYNTQFEYICSNVYLTMKKKILFLHKLAPRGHQRSNPGWPNIQICLLFHFLRVMPNFVVLSQKCTILYYVGLCHLTKMAINFLTFLK